jgi:hypothetical protein
MSIASFTPSRTGTIWLRNSAAEYRPGSGGWAFRHHREFAPGANAKINVSRVLVE